MPAAKPPTSRVEDAESVAGVCRQLFEVLLVRIGCGVRVEVGTRPGAGAHAVVADLGQFGDRFVETPPLQPAGTGTQFHSVFTQAGEDRLGQLHRLHCLVEIGPGQSDGSVVADAVEEIPVLVALALSVVLGQLSNLSVAD